jgi:hypothetical protein
VRHRAALTVDWASVLALAGDLRHMRCGAGIGTVLARKCCLAIAILALLAGAASAQQAPKVADPKTPQPPSSPSKFAAPVTAGAQQPSQPSPPKIAIPPPEALLVLVRSALIGLDHANRTGNYTVLRELGGPGLQRHSSAQLSNAFTNLRNQQVDLLAVAILTPQLTQPPSVSPEGLLRLIGFFPSQPRRIQFEIIYQPVGGQWKLFGISVSLAAAAPPAPEASPAPAPPSTEGKVAPSGAPAPAKKK